MASCDVLCDCGKPCAGHGPHKEKRHSCRGSSCWPNNCWSTVPPKEEDDRIEEDPHSEDSEEEDDRIEEDPHSGDPDLGSIVGMHSKGPFSVIQGGIHPQTSQVFAEANFVWIRLENGELSRTLTFSNGMDAAWFGAEIEDILEPLINPGDVIVFRMGIDIAGEYRSHWWRQWPGEGEEEDPRMNELVGLRRSVLYDAAKAHYSPDGGVGDPERDAYLAGWKDGTRKAGADEGREVGAVPETPESGWHSYLNETPMSDEAIEVGQRWEDQRTGSTYVVEETGTLQVSNCGLDCSSVVICRHEQHRTVQVFTALDLANSTFFKLIEEDGERDTEEPEAQEGESSPS